VIQIKPFKCFAVMIALWCCHACLSGNSNCFSHDVSNHVFHHKLNLRHHRSNVSCKKANKNI